MKKETTIDAVGMVRKIRDRHYEINKGKSSAERIAFYRNKANKLKKSLSKKVKTDS